MEQVPDVDAVVIPVGGGGLIAGCAVALKTMNPNIKIIVRKKYSEKNSNCTHFIHLLFSNYLKRKNTSTREITRWDKTM